MSLLSLQLQAGAVSGGGGGTTNPDPVSKDRIARSLYDIAAPALITWFNSEEVDYLTFGKINSRAPKALKRFIADSNRFKEIVFHLQVDLMQSVPCLDLYGRPNDASVHSVNEGSICMSAFTMAPKLNEYNVDQEIVALLAHEVAHLFGADEEEAHELQIYLLEFLYRNSVAKMKTAIEQYASNNNFYFTNLRSISTQMELRPSIISSYEISQISKNMHELLNQIIVLNSGYNLLDAQATMAFAEIKKITMLLEDFVCSVEQNNPEQKECIETYNKGFGGKEEVTIYEYYANLFYSPVQRDGFFKVQKLKTVDDLKKYGKLIYDYNNNIFNYIYNLKYQQVGINRID